MKEDGDKQPYKAAAKTKSMVVDAYNPSTPEVEEEGSGVQSQLGLLNKSEAGLGYMKAPVSV